MNTKFSFTLLFVVFVLIVAACTPAITDGAAPVAIAVPPADNAAVVPVTGNSAPETARSESQAPRLWSGEVFLSDNDSPDVHLNAQPDLRNVCMSEDSLPRRYSGCVE